MFEYKCKSHHVNISMDVLYCYQKNNILRVMFATSPLQSAILCVMFATLPLQVIFRTWCLQHCYCKYYPVRYYMYVLSSTDHVCSCRQTNESFCDCTHCYRHEKKAKLKGMHVNIRPYKSYRMTCWHHKLLRVLVSMKRLFIWIVGLLNNHSKTG